MRTNYNLGAMLVAYLVPTGIDVDSFKNGLIRWIGRAFFGSIGLVFAFILSGFVLGFGGQVRELAMGLGMFPLLVTSVTVGLYIYTAWVAIFRSTELAAANVASSWQMGETQWSYVVQGTKIARIILVLFMIMPFVQLCGSLIEDPVSTGWKWTIVSFIYLGCISGIVGGLYYLAKNNNYTNTFVPLKGTISWLAILTFLILTAFFSFGEVGAMARFSNYVLACLFFVFTMVIGGIRFIQIANLSILGYFLLNTFGIRLTAFCIFVLMVFGLIPKLSNAEDNRGLADVPRLYKDIDGNETVESAWIMHIAGKPLSRRELENFSTDIGEGNSLVKVGGTASQTIELVDERKVLGEEPIQNNKTIIFVADGGGIHALFRAGTVLSEATHQIEGFSSNIFATSTISGGSIGTAIYCAIEEAILRQRERKAEKKYDVREEFAKVMRSNLLTPVIGKLLFSEWLGLIKWDFDGADRGKGLELAVLGSLDSIAAPLRFDAKEYLKRNILDIDGIKTITRTNFNATVSSSGDRLVFGSMKLKSLRSIANLQNAQGVSILSAACTSARFPLVTGPARIRVGRQNGEDQNVYLIDGGLYENSGIETAIEILREIRLVEGNPENWSDVMICVVGNGVEGAPGEESDDGKFIGFPRTAGDAAMYGPSMLENEKLENELTMLLKASAGNVLTRNFANGRKVFQACKEYSAHLVFFPWCGDVIGTPLGWYLSPQRQALISWNLGTSGIYTDSQDKQGDKLRFVEFDENPPINVEFEPSKNCVECSNIGLRELAQITRFSKKQPIDQMKAVRRFNQKNFLKLFLFIDPEWKPQKGDNSWSNDFDFKSLKSSLSHKYLVEEREKFLQLNKAK